MGPDGLFHMIYRAQGDDRISRLGYAVSYDGIDWMRLDKPVFVPEADYEAWGVEDPRITWLEDRWYMVYVGFSPQGTRVCLASTTNFIHWERHGVILPDVDNKDAALFPEKVNGRYCLLHRIPDDIWIAYSDDLLHWTDQAPIMSPRRHLWDGRRIGAAGPPIRTDEGWLLIYHGYDEARVYCLGAALLDLEDPRTILSRPDEPILTPELPWERKGDVPNVVFSDAAVLVGDELYVYYGGADRVMGLATVPLADLMAFLDQARSRKAE